MARIFVSGSTDGLGLATATSLLEQGHEVLVHSRNSERLSQIQPLLNKGAKAVIGDLSQLAQQISVAEQINQHGHIDVAIHNAGTTNQQDLFSVNVLAPYVLSALVPQPTRLIYLSSSMHFDGRKNLELGSAELTYSDSKLLVTTLSNAIANRWPDSYCFSVDPGWVPTKMGGAHAPDDFIEGYQTQVWLATTNILTSLTSGTYWHHRQCAKHHIAAEDEQFQTQLLNHLEKISGIVLP
ncbi:SDR family NAD(P)-dependent oxidoreductase [Vibrio tritonius]|uniref:SDR family NAD(P)-dependent oxidoreductase n=1 Tax=Vibrio tritonius TaxID=1435069 RepID=A0ABS7YPY3_9VIBR|nr:SDR family NAD(P)-dependent oxidoreductase [Vibrio tritonius]MCA2017730.1 SDR family NAD(P)-dependent oxidoreductase [Vibrio tritonius]